MFGFKKKTPAANQDDHDKHAQQSLEQGLEKTRGGLFSGLKGLFTSKQRFDADLIDDIEERLLMADVGVEATQEIILQLNSTIKKDKIQDTEGVFHVLKLIMSQMLAGVHRPLVLDDSSRPAMILVVGVNGAGKTTTIGKLAKKLQHSGHSVMLAAGDTFRAAAVEQLQVWGQRNEVPVIAQSMGADSAAVVFDALESARARDLDILIADTAGRLHTKHNLMDELKKVRRVVDKFDSALIPEVLLVLDATTGQNALMQARQFHQDIGVTGIALTKLDGTAKGGIIFALANELKIPIRFIGLGEGVDDLREFEPQAFVEALLNLSS